MKATIQLLFDKGKSGTITQREMQFSQIRLMCSSTLLKINKAANLSGYE
jgi:hypothetical protein